MEEIVDMIHGDDERVSLGTLDLTYQVYIELAKKISNLITLMHIWRSI
jgi:hypothetical protein